MSDVETQSSRRCVEPGCTFDTDGVCLEGFPAAKGCPYKSQPSEGEASESTSEPDTPSDGWVLLPDGYELSLEATANITRATEAKVIVVAGESAAGKTTLLTCIFEHISEGVYAGQQFAWSDTVLAFERACYPSRISSEAEEPETERTKRLIPRFFHLQVKSEAGKLTDLLLTDMSGEVYRRVVDNQENATSLGGFIRRADFFVLLLDGKRLASKELRQDGFRRGLLLLEALLQAHVLSKMCPVRVLIAKYDLLVPEQDNENIVKFIEYVEAEYKRFGTEHFSDFKVSRISSRPKENSSLDYGFGVEPLFSEWVTADRAELNVDFLADVKELPNERESINYLWRQLGRQKE